MHSPSSPRSRVRAGRIIKACGYYTRAGRQIAPQRDASAGRSIFTSRYSSPNLGADPILGPIPGGRPIRRSRPRQGPILDPSLDSGPRPGPTPAEQGTRRRKSYAILDAIRGADPWQRSAADLRPRSVADPRAIRGGPVRR